MTEINSQNSESAEQKPRGRLTLISIFAIALVPMALATYMYFNDVLVPQGRTNKGTLILPPLEFDELQLTNDQGEPLRIADIEEKWLLLVLSEGSCTELCKSAIYKARQVNVALHKDSQRVVRYYLDVSTDGAGALEERIKADYPQLISVKADRYHLKRYLDRNLDANAAMGESYIFVVDPIGNIMMYYTPENSGKDILEDLKRLLKVSRIG